MTRPPVTVTVTSDFEPDAPPVHEETRRAFNAGIRASEAFVREAGRTAGCMFTGGPPERYDTADGTVYHRTWVADDGSDVLRVTVSK